ncbi:hypothetical protein [Flavobacterium sp. N2038]|uniref:hypothetical protein n=1 Tax=Flavobacterium sp. N2038 TaxID=2986829 RepID=UPI00222531A7|nr:hypothetical protein [Flavobacterium sp. N2038]
MKTKMIVIFFAFLSCNESKKENISAPINNTIIMKKINTDYLNKINETNLINEKIQFVENDTNVVLIDYGDHYFESKRRFDESIINYIIYNKKNNQMISSGTYFYNSPIDIYRKYNEKGEVIQETDNNKDFPFSISDLIEKIKITHKINLNDGKIDRTVNRGIDEKTGRPTYSIQFDINKDEGHLNYITIDGKTGEILSEGRKQIL